MARRKKMSSSQKKSGKLKKNRIVSKKSKLELLRRIYLPLSSPSNSVSEHRSAATQRQKE
jgi:hypothetical protein